MAAAVLQPQKISYDVMILENGSFFDKKYILKASKYGAERNNYAISELETCLFYNIHQFFLSYNRVVERSSK